VRLRLAVEAVAQAAVPVEQPAQSLLAALR
jgi:hypothetical protein